MTETREGPRPEPMAGDEIGRLLRAAGPRAAVPAEDLARLESAARDEWRRLVERRHRRGLPQRLLVPLALAASLVLAVAIGWRWLSLKPPVTPTTVATVETVAGAVWARSPADEEALAVRVGFPVVAGSELTSPTGQAAWPARAALRMAGGQSVRLAPGSTVRAVSTHLLELVEGAVYVDSGAQPSAEAAMEVLTPFGRVLERGTQFEVRLLLAGDEQGASLRVRVREGAIDLLHGAESHAAEKGQELTLMADGSVDLVAVAPYGAEWEWVLAAAPALDLEGRSLETFLEWVSRETGRRIYYADPGVERDVATIGIHGAIEGLTPDQALEAVLPGTGLGYRIEDGQLTIMAGTAAPGP